MECKENNIKNQVFNKPSALVAAAPANIQDKPFFLQKLVFDYLLKYAQPTLKTGKPRHYTTIGEIAKALGRRNSGRDNEHLERALKANLNQTLEFNILEKDTAVWDGRTVFEQIKISKPKKGSAPRTVEYAFVESIVPMLVNPGMYVRLRLFYQKQLTNSHAYTLYQLAADYLDEKRNEGETRWLSTKTIRALFGVRNKHKRFRDFRRRCLDRPAAEINKKTDLHIEFDLRNDTNGGPEPEIKFFVKRNPEWASKVEIADKREAHQLLVDKGVSASAAGRLVKEYHLEEIEAVVNAVPGDMASPVAYITASLQNNRKAAQEPACSEPVKAPEPSPQPVKATPAAERHYTNRRTDGERVKKQAEFESIGSITNTLVLSVEESDQQESVRWARAESKVRQLEKNDPEAYEALKEYTRKKLPSIYHKDLDNPESHIGMLNLSSHIEEFLNRKI